MRAYRFCGRLQIWCVCIQQSDLLNSKCFFPLCSGGGSNKAYLTRLNFELSLKKDHRFHDCYTVVTFRQGSDCFYLLRDLLSWIYVTVDNKWENRFNGDIKWGEQVLLYEWYWYWKILFQILITLSLREVWSHFIDLVHMEISCPF